MLRSFRSRFAAACAALLLLASTLSGSAGDPCPVPYEPDTSGNKLVLTGSPFDGLEVTASYLRKAGDDAPLVVYDGDLAVDGTPDLFTQRPLDGLGLTSLGVAAAAGPGGYTIESIYDSLALFFDTDPTLPLHGVAFEGGPPPNRVDPQPAGYQISRRGTTIVFRGSASSFPCEFSLFPYIAAVDTTTGFGSCYDVAAVDQTIADWKLSSDRSWLVYLFRDFNSSVGARLYADHLDFSSFGQLQSALLPDDIFSAPDVNVRADGLALTHAAFDFGTVTSTVVSLGVGFPVRTLSTGNEFGPTSHFSDQGDRVVILQPYLDGGIVRKLLVGSVDSGSTSTIADPSPVDVIDETRFTPGESHFAFSSASSTALYVAPVAAGGPVTQIPTAGNTIGELGFTPDGTTLLYIEERSSDQALELWAVGVGGGTPVSIGPVPAAGATGVTRWTHADGRLIVYGGFDGATFQLYSMESDGTDLQPIGLPGPADSVADFWVFDGGIVLKLDGSSQLWLAPAIGGAAAALTLPGTEDDVADPQVAEDGSFFIYDARIAGADRETVIYFADPDLDSDGTLNASDNCLAVPNTDQADADGDCAGDVCDVCPLDPLDDADGDLFCAPNDNCPGISNIDQLDADADSVGDVCDTCTDLDGDGFGDPGFPVNTCPEDICPMLSNPSQDDGDMDGLGSACDNCPTMSNPEQRIATAEVISAPFQAGGAVFEFAFTPDGTRTVYRADQDIDGATELYSVPTAGGTVVKLNPPLASNQDVLAFKISPLGDLVGYISDHETPGQEELFVVPVTGGASMELNGTLTAGGDVVDFQFTPDGSRILYLADQDVNFTNELYSVAVTGGLPSKLNQPGVTVAAFAISPDSERAVFRADPDVALQVEIFSVGTAVSGPPGAPIKLNGALVSGGDVSSALISPDSATVVYLADQETDNVDELYTVPMGGGLATKLNGTLVPGGGEVDEFYLISPNGAQVVYTAPQDAALIYEIHSVPITGGATVKLSDVPTAGGVVTGFFAISPDSAQLVYMAEQDTDNVRELYRAPMLGGGSVKLSAPLVANGDVQNFSLSGDGTYVAYRADAAADEVIELFGVPLAGGPVARLSGDMAPGGDALTFAIAPDGEHVVYWADQDTNQTWELYAARTSGGLLQKLNGVLAPGGSAANEYLVTPASDAVVFAANGNPAGLEELYRVVLEPDTDADGIVDVCDCAPGDASAFSPPAEVADLRLEEDRVTLVWAPGTVDAGPGVTYDLVRGAVAELPVGPGASETCVDTAISGTSYEDTFDPLAGDAAYYLLRAVNVCGIGSYGFESPPGPERLTGVCP